MSGIDLDAIQARADAATEGPWEVWLNMDGAITVCDRFEHPLTRPDVRFIRHARTDVPVLVAALRAVLALHRAVEVEPSDTICARCSTLRGAGESLRYFPVTEWPCATVRAIAAHIDTTPKENER